jgi:hypothetical protein
MTNDSTYTDALGNPIVIGKLYGYNQYSSGIFSNARFMPLQLLTVKGSEKKTVKGLMCNDGSFCYGERSGEPEVSEVRKISLHNFRSLWPISDEVASLDPSCLALKAFK